jgi:hypothetical protein
MTKTAAEIGVIIRARGAIKVIEEHYRCSDDLTLDKILQEAQSLFDRLDDALVELDNFAWYQEV